MPRAHRGFTLAELLIALVIGVFLMGGMMHLLWGSQQSYRFHEAFSRLQEDGRFLADRLSHDLRMTGLTGCPASGTVANLLPNPSASWWTDAAAGALRGYDGSAAIAGGPAFGSAPGARIAGTDALLTWRGGENDWVLHAHLPTNSPPALILEQPLGDAIPTGTPLLVCDLDRTTLLAATNVTGATLQYAGAIPAAYQPGSSTVTQFLPSLVYVGVGADGGATRALYRWRLAVAGGTLATRRDTLAEGVDNLQIVYRLDREADARDASAVTDWGRVRSLRLDLLLVSPDDNLNLAPPSVVFPNADTGLAQTGGIRWTAADRRVYQPFSFTVALRNRLP